MNNHKLIMESWRKFLKEYKSAVTEIDGRPIHLYYRKTWRDNFNVTLYTVTEENKTKILNIQVKDWVLFFTTWRFPLLTLKGML